MKRLIIAVAGVALLAGCSGSEDAGASAGEAASVKTAPKQAAVQAGKPRPGFYKATITLTEIAIPGMPPEMEGHGAGMVTTTDYCVTEADVAKGYQDMLKQGQNGECSFESFKADGAAIEGVMLCQTPEGAKRTTMSGTTSPTTAEFTASTKVNFDGVGEATMNFAGKHERIGDCPAR